VSQRQSLAARVAASLDLPAAALPLAAELFSDLEGLGTSRRRAAMWLHGAGVGHGDRVIDLGCGKGAPAVAVAQRCGCVVHGIDGFGPFVESARGLAHRVGMETRCTFEVGDLLTRKSRRVWDAGMMLSVLPALDAAKVMARHVKPGGLVLLDDAVRVARVQQEAWLPGTMAELREQLEDAGHRVVRQHVMTRAEVTRMDATLYRRIAAQARVMARRDAKTAALVREVLRRQREAHRVLTGPIRPAIVLIQLGN
jgi:cyclopropane fatty-acyl-phospholipid synthase-like methyltransferase